MKNAFKYIRNIVLGILLVVYLLIIILVSTLVLNKNDYGYTEFDGDAYISITDDIETDLYKKGTLVVVQKQKFSDYKVGDTIFYYDTSVKDEIHVKVATIASITDEGSSSFVTLDNETSWGNDYIAGYVVKTYDNIGGIIDFLESKWIFFILLIVPCFFILLYEVYLVVIAIKYGDDEDDEVVAVPITGEDSVTMDVNTSIPPKDVDAVIPQNATLGEIEALKKQLEELKNQNNVVNTELDKEEESISRLELDDIGNDLVNDMDTGLDDNDLDNKDYLSGLSNKVDIDDNNDTLEYNEIDDKIPDLGLSDKEELVNEVKLDDEDYDLNLDLDLDSHKSDDMVVNEDKVVTNEEEVSDEVNTLDIVDNQVNTLDEVIDEEEVTYEQEELEEVNDEDKDTNEEVVEPKSLHDEFTGKVEIKDVTSDDKDTEGIGDSLNTEERNAALDDFLYKTSLSIFTKDDLNTIKKSLDEDKDNNEEIKEVKIKSEEEVSVVEPKEIVEKVKLKDKKQKVKEVEEVIDMKVNGKEINDNDVFNLDDFFNDVKIEKEEIKQVKDTGEDNDIFNAKENKKEEENKDTFSGFDFFN